MIFLIYGSQGSGKTLYLAKKGFEAHNKGMKVYSNFKLNFKHEILTFSQLINCELNNAVVLIDEASIYGFSSRQSMTKANIELVKTFIPQIRKNSVSLYASFQRPRQADVQLRSQSDYALFMTKFIYNKSDRILLDCTQSQQFNNDVIIIIKCDIVQGDTGKESSFTFLANPYYKLYDTTEVIKLGNKEKEDIIDLKHGQIKKKKTKKKVSKKI